MAIDDDSSDNQKNALPKYCFKIEENLQKFGSKEVAEHLKNYAGQICDKYLTQDQNNSVFVKGTTDEIRREVIWLRKNRVKFDKNDQKSLDEYLEILD